MSKFKVESIEFPLRPFCQTHITINGKATLDFDQFFIKREGKVYVLDYWLDKTGQNLGWCGAFKKLNEPTSLLYFRSGGHMSYDIKKKVIESAIPEGVWKADWKDIVEAGLRTDYKESVDF